MKIYENSLNLAKMLNVEKNKQFRHFAFIYERNKLIAIGQNQMEITNSGLLRLMAQLDIKHYPIYPYVHAETAAILKMWGRHFICPRMSLVSIRLSKDNKELISRPCDVCNKVIEKLKLRLIYYDGQKIC